MRDVLADALASPLRVAAAAASSATAGAASLHTDWAEYVFGVPLTILLAGFAGTLVMVWLLPAMQRWWQLPVTVGLGTMLAGFLQVLVSDAFDLKVTHARGVAFLLGALGLILLRLVVGEGKEILGAFLDRIRGPGGAWRTPWGRGGRDES